MAVSGSTNSSRRAGSGAQGGLMTLTPPAGVDAEGVGAERREEGAPEGVVLQQAEHPAQDRAHVISDGLGVSHGSPERVLLAGDPLLQHRPEQVLFALE